ncbi:MAG: hypothetical protein JSW62_06125 [Thermoplasmatales archaeon]|nr:MAG: hypothetical protein JSW62_06125 [Thermoplasmatales archaeon]
MLEIFGTLPLWVVFVGIIIIAVLAWAVIKFAIKILLVLVVFFAILIGLDALNVFEWIQNLFSSVV